MTNDPGQTPPPWAGQPAYPPPAPEPSKKSWLARHKVLTAVLAVVGLLVVLSGIGAAIGPAEKDTADVASVSSPSAAVTAREPAATTQAPAATTNPTTEAPPETTKAAPELTAGQENALGSAKSYLDISGFSRLGLIQQLSSPAGDGYSVADATYAADHVGANWNEQAVRSAKSYLEITHFSRSGLIQQLSSSAGDKYTRAQATYAADKVGL